MPSSRLRDVLDAYGGNLQDLTVLAQANDPLRVDTDTGTGRRDGSWLADRIAALRLTGPKHLRGLHYIMYDLPDVPVAELDGDQPEPLLDTCWSFVEQCRRLIASKNYAPDLRAAAGLDTIDGGES